MQLYTLLLPCLRINILQFCCEDINVCILDVIAVKISMFILGRKRSKCTDFISFIWPQVFFKGRKEKKPGENSSQRNKC